MRHLETIAYELCTVLSIPMYIGVLLVKRQISHFTILMKCQSEVLMNLKTRKMLHLEKIAYKLCIALSIPITNGPLYTK